MLVLDAFIALICVYIMSAFLILKAKVASAFAPITVICTIALWISVGGMLGLLFPFGLLVYILGAACLVYLILTRKKYRNILQKILSPATMFFVLASLGAFLYLAIRKPLVSEWDEFSLWATGVKLMKFTGELYTTADMGWHWIASQTPALPSIAYFSQLLGTYAPWKIYAGYAMLMISVVCALIGNLNFKQYKIYVPLALSGLLVPWFFSVFSRQYSVKLVWLSSYGDIPSGMLFGGVLLLYFGLRSSKSPVWPVYPVLAALSLSKDNTFIFSLIASMIIALDFIFFADKTPKRLKGKNAGFFKKLPSYAPGRYPLPGRLLRSAGFFAVSLAPYLIWTKYIGILVKRREQAGQTGSTSESIVAVVINCLKMLFGIDERSEQFQTALDKMLSAFYSGAFGFFPGDVYKVSMIGNGLVTSAFIIGIFILAIIFAKDNTLRKRCALAMSISTLGFIAYYFELIFSYGRIFKPVMVENLENYGRYLSSFYVGWFLLALCCLGLAARNSRPYGILSGANIALAIGMWVLCAYMLPARTSDIGYPNAFYQSFRQEEKTARLVSDIAGPGERVFFVSQGDHVGIEWFHYSYYMLPSILDYSGVPVAEGGLGGGGGTFVLPYSETAVPGMLQYTAEEIARYLINENCSYVFIERLDGGFVENYSQLFEDGLKNRDEYEHMLYKAENRNGEYVLEFVDVEQFKKNS